jgi:23S rRNA (uracil1939-C5)-methyltransferase
VTRAVQLEQKAHIVERALGRIDEMREVGPAYGYRDRARLQVGRSADGRPTLGFRGWRSHEVIDVPRCPLLSPALDSAFSAIRAEAAAAPPGTEVVVAAGGGSEVSARIGDRTWGAPFIDVAEPGSPPLRIPPGAFAQVGAAANAALVAAVLEAVGPDPGRVLELHAGSGNFTRHLVRLLPGPSGDPLRLERGAAALVASDADREAVERGRRNVPAAEWVQRPGAGPFDTVVVDPPREGLDAAALALAGKVRGRLVYVSCDPQTLGRDAGRLSAAGLALERVVALDLMPQTYHVEVVATFRRR